MISLFASEAKLKCFLLLIGPGKGKRRKFFSYVEIRYSWLYVKTKGKTLNEQMHPQTTFLPYVNKEGREKKEREGDKRL